MNMTNALRLKAERFKRRPCAHCGADVEYIIMHRTIKSSGDSLYYWFCTRCNRRAARAAGENISHELLDAWIEHGKFPGVTKREDFPILYVYTGEPCVVCGDTDTQEHHWALLSVMTGLNGLQCTSAHTTIASGMRLRLHTFKATNSAAKTSRRCLEKRLVYEIPYCFQPHGLTRQAAPG